MKTKVFPLFALAAVVLASCTSSLKNEPTNKAEKVPVAFNATAVSNPVGNTPRRIGANGVVNTLAELQSNHEKIGVFGFYTGNDPFNRTTSLPNFMWNEELAYDGAAWAYSPIKYWPNEWANVIEHGATSTDGQADKLSFFAYSPYVAAPAAGPGITGMSGNTAGGTPWVEYEAVSEGTGVDLMWAVSQAAGTWGTNSTVAAGMPFKNLVKPADPSASVPFHMRHALARVAATVKLAATPDPNTKVFIEKFELISADGSTPIFNSTGRLELDNTVANVPTWTNEAGTFHTYKFAHSEFTPAIALAGYNPSTDVVSWWDAGTNTVTANAWDAHNALTGLTNAAQPLLLTSAGLSNFGAFFVPGAGADFKIRVKYWVITSDGALAFSSSAVPNDITSVTIPAITLEAGKITVLNVQLSLQDVKCTVQSIETWSTAGLDYVIP